MNTESERWEIANPQGRMSFPELHRYTPSDTWQVSFDGQFASEEEALAAIDELQNDPDMDGWYATWKQGGPFVETIIAPRREPDDEDTDEEWVTR